MWHGWADQLIFAGGTVDYMKRVQQQTAVPRRPASSPGCSWPRAWVTAAAAWRGASGQFDAVVKWVEQGLAPETLQGVKRDQAGTVTMSRPICQYPLTARFKGRGTRTTSGVSNVEQSGRGTCPYFPDPKLHSVEENR